jgi:hypothetical protein
VTQPGGHTVPFNPLKGVVFDALAHSFALGYLVSGVAALVAAVLALTILGRRHAHADAPVDAGQLA